MISSSSAKKLVAEPRFVARAWTPAEFVKITSREEDGNFDKVGGYPSLYPSDSIDDKSGKHGIFVCEEEECRRMRVFLCQLTDPDTGLVYQVFQCTNDDCPMSGDSPFSMRIISYSRTAVDFDRKICVPSPACYDHKRNLPDESDERGGSRDPAKFKAFKVSGWRPVMSIMRLDEFERIHKGNLLICKAFTGKDVIVDSDGRPVTIFGEPIQFGGRGDWAQTITDGDEDVFRLHLTPSFHLPMHFGDCGTAHFSPRFDCSTDMH